MLTGENLNRRLSSVFLRGHCFIVRWVIFIASGLKFSHEKRNGTP